MLPLTGWAERHIVIPDGQHMGRPFRVEYQPFFGLLFRELEGGPWRRVFLVGCVQSGKTLALLIVMLYWIIARAQKVVLGVPHVEMAQDKWREDVEPVIRAAGFDRLLPRRGKGSRGGDLRDVVPFRGAGTMKIMSGGGGDERRSGYTAAAAFVTEADKLDEVGGGSRETDKFSQIEARTGAYAERAFVLGESTASIKAGRVWREYLAGTQSRIACPCPHCGEYVTPEREHLVGWQEAATVVQAAAMARWVCPGCAETLSELQRVNMNRAAVLVHRGQMVTADGTLAGEPPETRTLGFSWNAFNNLFWSGAYVAEKEWTAAQLPDGEQHDNAERELVQFAWALPWDPPAAQVDAVVYLDVLRRATGPQRALVPTLAEHLTAAIDLGRRHCHWAVVAFAPDGSPHVVEYGLIESQSDTLGDEPAAMASLRAFRDLCRAGWSVGDALGPRRQPEAVFVDSGWLSEVVYRYCAETPDTYPTKGFGRSQTGRAYSRPRTGGPALLRIGEGYHAVRLPGQATALFEVDADAWKSHLQARLRTELGRPGALTLYRVDDQSDHILYAKHLTAESKVSEYDARRGQVVEKWVNATRKPNHWLDATSLALAAGHFVGVRVLQDAPPPTPDMKPRRESLPQRRHGIRRTYA